MLKITRVSISIVVFSLITFYFLDFAGLMSDKVGGMLTKLQFIPAIISFSVIILLILIVVTLLFGRAYCSSICPMGVYQDIIAWTSKRTAPKKKRYKFSKARHILRVSILVASVSIILKFPLITALIDPYSAYGRIVTDVFRPVYMAGNNVLEMILTRFENYTFYKTDIFINSVFTLVVAILTLAIIGYIAWRHGRTYCNTICPVGTILGFLSRFSIFRIRIDKSKCNSCGQCEKQCKASCISSKQKTVDNSRCVDCFNCLNVCRRNALKYTPSSPVTPRKEGISTPVDKRRRRFLTTGIITAVSVPIVVVEDEINSLTGNDRYIRQQPILPPGAVSIDNMLCHCTSCHLCISKCPSQVLRPAFMEYGLVGMMQPTMYFDKGFCNYDCTDCSKVCPNGAIKPLTVDEKHLNQGGHVVFTRDICVVQTDETNCGACSEHCPTQAVTMVPYKDGLTIPQINIEICIGCGGCEFICPVRPFRAIHVEGHAVQSKAKPFEEQKKDEKEIDSFGF